MIKQINNLPSGIIGFEASGEVTANDYETVIFPAIENKLKESPKFRMLYHVGKDFQKFDIGAMWDDAKFGLKYLSEWEKVAMVTDVEWIHNAVKAMSFIMHGRVKIFSNSEMQQAVDWLTK